MMDWLSFIFAIMLGTAWPVANGAGLPQAKRTIERPAKPYFSPDLPDPARGGPFCSTQSFESWSSETTNGKIVSRKHHKAKPTTTCGTASGFDWPVPAPMPENFDDTYL